jgi:hypothetical protein
MAAEYRGFDFGRKAEIAHIDRRKRLKNHDVVFKRREPFEAPRGPEPDPGEARASVPTPPPQQPRAEIAVCASVAVAN